MKTSQLFSLTIAFALLTTTVFAVNTKTETKNASTDSSEELYVNPLEEVLAMQDIPEIILESDIRLNPWLYVNAEEEYVNPLKEVLEMENIPEVKIYSTQNLVDIEYTDPLQEVLQMEEIPNIILDSELIANSK